MDRNLKLFGLQFAALLVVCAVALFLPAGRLAWAPGWVFLALFMGFFLGMNLWLLKHNPGLFQERLHFSAANQEGWDRLLFPLLAGFPFVWLVFISLDAGRFHWSPLSVWIQALGALLLLGSFYLFFLTFRENAFLSPVVRIQGERGHAVISSGPYRFVRHPMYAGMLIFTLATPLLLGSGCGILFGLVFVLLLARRAVLEERVLRLELTGYADYMRRVHYRFIPYIW